MTVGGLSVVQADIIRALADFDPPWTLTGGGALVAAHLQHRHTRDLDLFWQGRETLDPLVRRVISRLAGAGFEVEARVSEASFARLAVTRGEESTVVDLVADAVPVAEPPTRLEVAGVRILVDTPHELLVNKLTTLLSRSEPRDLLDVKALLDAGGDLRRALTDAARKDGGLSALTLAWVLDGLPLLRLGAAAGFDESTVSELDTFRAELAARLSREGRP